MRGVESEEASDAQRVHPRSSTCSKTRRPSPASEAAREPPFQPLHRYGERSTSLMQRDPHPPNVRPVIRTRRLPKPTAPSPRMPPQQFQLEQRLCTTTAPLPTAT